jgi:hypothetical protein
MTRRSRRHSPLAWFVALLALVAVLNAVAVVERLAGPLLLLTAAGLVVWAVARRGRRPVLLARPPKVIQGHAEDAEVIRLRARVAQLSAELDEARESARMAWQDASDPDAADPGPQRPAADTVTVAGRYPVRCEAAMTGDRYRPLTAAAVLLVAIIAAVVSYMHVATLGPAVRATATGRLPAAAVD